MTNKSDFVLGALSIRGCLLRLMSPLVDNPKKESAILKQWFPPNKEDVMFP